MDGKTVVLAEEASLCVVVNFVAANAVKVLSWLRPNC